MKRQIYLDIKNRLKLIPGPDEQPAIKHFDLWNKQTDFLEQETPVETPAVVVEFAGAEWHQLGNQEADTDLQVALHIVTQDFMQTADYSPMEMEALAYLDLIDTVRSYMQGFAPTHCNRMMCSRSIPNHNHERYVDSVEEFVCRWRWKPLFQPFLPPEKVPVEASLDIVVNPADPQTPGSAGCAPTAPACGPRSHGDAACRFSAPPPAPPAPAAGADS